MRRLAALGLSVALVSSSGCGLLLDTAYWMGDKKTHKSVTESRPTGRTLTATEMDGSVTPEGRLALSCASRTRSVELQWSVSKTYKYRGSFEGSTYVASAVLSGVFAAVTVIVFGAACAQDDLDVSCWNTLYASPFALDLGWSIYRGVTANPPKLIDKHASPARPAIGRAIASEPVECPVAEVHVGSVTGSSRDDDLAGQGSGAPRALRDGAVAMAIGLDGLVDLGAHANALELLATRHYAGIYFVDPTEGVTEVSVDRCAVLRSHLSLLSSETRTRAEKECPLKVPVQQ